MKIKGCNIDSAKFVYEWNTYRCMNLCTYELVHLWTLCIPDGIKRRFEVAGTTHVHDVHMHMQYNIDRNQYKFGNGYLTAEGAYEYGNVNVRIQKLYSWARLRDTQY